jgi:hypothetical protein
MYFNDAKYSTLRCLPDGPFAGRLFQKDGNPVKRLDNEVPSFTMNSHELVFGELGQVGCLAVCSY